MAESVETQRISSEEANLLKGLGIRDVKPYPWEFGVEKLEKRFAPAVPGDSYLLITDEHGRRLVVRENKLRNILSLDEGERIKALNKEYIENLGFTKKINEFEEHPRKDVFKEYEGLICGGLCALFLDRLLDRFPPDEHSLSHLIDVADAVTERASKVVDGKDDFREEHPFIKYWRERKLPTIEFEYDYGPPRLPRKIIEVLQKEMSVLKEGNVRSVEEIPGDNKAVKLTFNDGTSGRVRISRLLDALPAPAKNSIQRAMTEQLPHGVRRVRVELSIDPLDIVAKSTGQGWKSCESLGGIYSDGIYDDIRNINAIAIVRTAPLGKPFPKQWTSRFMLRWCDVDGASKKPDVGIEPRAYGGNEKLNEMAMKKVKEALEKDGYLGYRLCVTPYEYYGYSDQAALFTDKAAGYEIAYGPDAKNYYIEKHGISEIDFQDYYHDYDYYGICLREDRDFENLYYEGILAELLHGEWSPEYDFYYNTGCQIIDKSTDPEGWARYLKWKELVELLPDSEDWLYEIPDELGIPDRFMHRYVLFRKNRDRVPDDDNPHQWRLYPIQFQNEPYGHTHNTIDIDKLNIDVMHDAFSNMHKCCENVYDVLRYAKTPEEDDLDRYAKCIYDWREKLLTEAGMGDDPNGKLRMDIPPDFNEAVKKFEQMDLTAVCNDLAESRRHFKEGQLVEPENRILINHYEDNPEHYGRVFSRISPIILNKDTDHPCGALMPLMYHCKLPLQVHGEAVFDDAKGYWVDGGYRSVPFEVWSKNPKYRCELEELEDTEGSQ